MSDEKLIKLKERLSKYQEAEIAILKGQEYSIKDRSLTRADLKTVRLGIRDLQNQISKIERGGVGIIRRVIPRDL